MLFVLLYVNSMVLKILIITPIKIIIKNSTPPIKYKIIIILYMNKTKRERSEDNLYNINPIITSFN